MYPCSQPTILCSILSLLDSEHQMVAILGPTGTHRESSGVTVYT